MTFRNRKTNLALIPAALTLAIPAIFASPAQANVFHRHPVASSVGAGMMAHHMAKHSHRHGFMHRHPVMTGLAAGAVTHHMLKHHHHRP